MIGSGIEGRAARSAHNGALMGRHIDRLLRLSPPLVLESSSGRKKQQACSYSLSEYVFLHPPSTIESYIQ